MEPMKILNGMLSSKSLGALVGTLDAAAFDGAAAGAGGMCAYL